MWASKTEINWRMSRLACGCGQLLPTAARTGNYITLCLCASYVSKRVWESVLTYTTFPVGNIQTNKLNSLSFTESTNIPDIFYNNYILQINSFDKKTKNISENYYGGAH